jgi:hypothetical protein
MSEVLIEFIAVDSDPADVERLMLGLREQILEFPRVESVSQASAGPAPAGSRGLDLSSLGALVVGIQPTVTLLGMSLTFVQRWLNPGDRRGTMRVAINVSRSS